MRLLEEAQLLRAWGPLPATRQVRDSHASEGVLDGGHRQMDLVHAPQPDKHQAAGPLKRLVKLLADAGSLATAGAALIGPLQTLAGWLGAHGAAIISLLAL